MPAHHDRQIQAVLPPRGTHQSLSCGKIPDHHHRLHLDGILKVIRYFNQPAEPIKKSPFVIHKIQQYRSKETVLRPTLPLAGPADPFVVVVLLLPLWPCTLDTDIICSYIPRLCARGMSVCSQILWVTMPINVCFYCC